MEQDPKMALLSPTNYGVGSIMPGARLKTTTAFPTLLSKASKVVVSRLADHGSRRGCRSSGGGKSRWWTIWAFCSALPRWRSPNMHVYRYIFAYMYALKNHPFMPREPTAADSPHALGLGRPPVSSTQVSNGAGAPSMSWPTPSIQRCQSIGLS